MSSPPPTPPPELPTCRAENRFDGVDGLMEWPEEYRPGRYHPVHIGDTFKNSRYQIVRKLGAGAFSTVWLAFDQQNGGHVALKVVMAKDSTTSTELSILEYLAEAAPMHPGSKHVVVLKDSFTHSGPNGEHLCLVFEALGHSAASIMDKLPCNLLLRIEHTPRYPMWIAKRILRHSLLALAFLHQNGIVHGDLQPGNMLFVSQLDSVETQKLQQDVGDEKICRPLKRLDGKLDRWAPRYVVDAQPLLEYVDVGPGLEVKISDMGAAFWSSKPPKETATPLGLRAPELVLGLPFGRGIDIWSFGCLLFEFVTGSRLFFVFGRLQHVRDDAHLLALTDTLGNLPEHLFSKWTRASRYFGPNRQRISTNAEGPSEKYPETMPPYIFPSLEKRFKEGKPDCIDDEEAAVIIALIRRILNYDPEMRPTADELLKDPWFNEANPV